MDILSGRVYPLKLGFIGVVNRSQQDIQGNKLLSDALSAERDFFRTHPAYRNMATRCGTQYLAKSLNTTLMGHIRERLPDIKARLNTLMGQTQQELASYGDVAFAGKEHRGSLVLQLMTRFATSFMSSIDGTSSEISTKELCGGARIYYIFNSVFGNSLETIDPTPLPMSIFTYESSTSLTCLPCSKKRLFAAIDSSLCFNSCRRVS